MNSSQPLRPDQEPATSVIRHSAVCVNARGPAVRLASRNVDRYLVGRMTEGDVLRYSKPGDWGDPTVGDCAPAFLFVVPEGSHARHYPRSINSVPVKITRRPSLG